VGASRCVVHRVKPVVLCVEGCAPCRERAVVQCQWCSASGAVPVQQCQRYGLCYVARGVAAPPRSRRSCSVAAPPRSRRSCSVGEAPLVVVPNSWPQWTRRRRAPPGHAKAQGRAARARARLCGQRLGRGIAWPVPLDEEIWTLLLLWSIPLVT